MRLTLADTLLFFLFLISMSLTIWGINIYRLTIIEIKYLFAVAIIGITVALFLLPRFLKSSYSKFWSFLITSAIGAGLFYFGFLFLNQRFADNHLQIEDFAILKRGKFPRGGFGSHCEQPYIIINFHGVEKQLVFYCLQTEMIKHAKKIELSYSRGAFGFNVIRSKQLLQIQN